MAARRRDSDPPDTRAMFLPLAVRSGDWGALDAAVFARRIPDFCHQVLNEGTSEPTAMLELQSVVDGGPVGWMRIDELPDREEAFAMLPPDFEADAVVVGEIAPVDGGLHLEFVAHGAEDDDVVTAKVGGTITLDDPVPGLLRIVRHLARLLQLDFREPPRGLLTRNGKAFACFLRGLDGEKLLSGELDIAVPDDREALVQPFAEALALDPGFGLALRFANATAALGLQGDRLEVDHVRRFLDRCYAAHPVDGEACVAIAEQLADLGDDDRALRWLRHATRLDPPPPRGLENLGILMARRGERGAARDLWQRGIDVDGHPDFCSHLAQLSFAEGREADAWASTLDGLRRLRERSSRPGEWDDGGRGGSALLECLHVQLGRRRSPGAVRDALLALCRLLGGDDRVMLGLCLQALGERAAARGELVAGLRAVVDFELRDQCVRAMLQIDVADFESRFARAAQIAVSGRRPVRALAEFRLWLHLQPEFWPALFYSALAKMRMRHDDEALDMLAAALEIAPDQPEVLFAMAEGFDRRRNPKRALELIEEALAVRPQDGRLLAARVRYLERLDRIDDARLVLEVCKRIGVDSAELRRSARRLRRRR